MSNSQGPGLSLAEALNLFGRWNTRGGSLGRCWWAAERGLIVCEFEVNSAEGGEAGDRVTEGKRGGATVGITI